MKKTLKISIIVLASVAIFLFIRYKITYPLLHVSYNGKVTHYRFDVKGYSYFEIDSNYTEFQMLYLDCDLKLGDSMVKKMDDKYIYHYRKAVLIGKYNAVNGHRYY